MQILISTIKAATKSRTTLTTILISLMYISVLSAGTGHAGGRLINNSTKGSKDISSAVNEDNGGTDVDRDDDSDEDDDRDSDSDVDKDSSKDTDAG